MNFPLSLKHNGLRKTVKKCEHLTTKTRKKCKPKIHHPSDTDTTTKVLELKEIVQNNLIKCPKCDFVAKSTQSMNSHWGKKHKIK